jgi:hypothetical protein
LTVTPVPLLSLSLSLSVVLTPHAGIGAMQGCVLGMHVELRRALSLGTPPVQGKHLLAPPLSVLTGVCAALREAFLRTHAQIVAGGATSGATAVAALIIGRRLYVANSGTSPSLSLCLCLVGLTQGR